MKDLTNTEKEELIERVKSFVDVTWDDQDTEDEIWRDIKSSINRIDDIAGIELDYLLDTETSDKLYNSMCYMGQELMKNRVFYIREKGLDDFEDNYQSEIVSLSVNGRIHKEVNNA